MKPKFLFLFAVMGSSIDLEGHWDKLQLNVEEEDPMLVEDDVYSSDHIKERRSLLEKVCIDRNIAREILKTTMGKIWRISELTIFQAIGKNIYTITFAMEADKHWVMNGHPWLFDNSLFVLKQLDGFTQPEAHSFNLKYFWL